MRYIKYFESYSIFLRESYSKVIWYEYETSDIINNLRNSDVSDILIPVTDIGLCVKVEKSSGETQFENGFSPEGSISISIWSNNSYFNYSDIKDDVEFLIKYIEHMGYKTYIFAYDSGNTRIIGRPMANHIRTEFMFRDISFANDRLINQINIYVK